MEDMGVEEGEEEEEAVRNDAMTIFRGHSGQYFLQNSQDVVQILTSLPSLPPFVPPSLPQPFFDLGSVFSVSLDPSNSLACSGGEDDKAFVWRTSDASVVMECTG